jgi:hypothetical protein
MEILSIIILLLLSLGCKMKRLMCLYCTLVLSYNVHQIDDVLKLKIAHVQFVCIWGFVIKTPG